MSRGSQVGRQRDDRGEGLLERRTGGEHRAVGGLDARPRPRRRAPRTGRRRRSAAKVRQRGCRLAVERHPVPAAQHGAVDDVAVVEAGTEVRAGAGPGEQPSRRRRARARPRGRRPCAAGCGPAGTSAEAAATSQPCVGRRSAAAQGGLDAGRLGLAPGAAQVVGRRLGEVAHRHAVAHLLTPGPVGAQQAHATTLTPRPRADQKRRVRAGARCRSSARPAVEVIPLAKPSTCGSNRGGTG